MTTYKIPDLSEQVRPGYLAAEPTHFALIWAARAQYETALLEICLFAYKADRYRLKIRLGRSDPAQAFFVQLDHWTSGGWATILKLRRPDQVFGDLQRPEKPDAEAWFTALRRFLFAVAAPFSEAVVPVRKFGEAP